MDDFESSSLAREIMDDIHYVPLRPDSPVIGFGFELVRTPDGKEMWSCSIRDGDGVWGGNIVTSTDENFMAKLRSINGQYVMAGLPVFYYEWIPADHVVLVPYGGGRRLGT